MNKNKRRDIDKKGYKDLSILLQTHKKARIKQTKGQNEAAESKVRGGRQSTSVGGDDVDEGLEETRRGAEDEVEVLGEVGTQDAAREVGLEQDVHLGRRAKMGE